MRRLVLPLVAVAALAGLTACGKSGAQKQEQGSEAASSEQPANPSAAQTAEPSDAEKKAIQAAYPAPYNTADLEDGKAKFNLCTACHTITPGGPNMTGPNLHGIIGRKAGAAPGFNYSDAVKNAGFAWDPAHLDKWLTSPHDMLPGTKMTFPGFKDPKDRNDVIAYVMVESGYKAK